jgi:glycosyltransferase involved in cell wall biosynthesis
MNVSVIIPVRNEEKYIRECLSSILNQDYSKEKMEVLVVNGCSSDSTEKIVKEIAEQHLFIRVLENTQKTVPTAMNLGICAAKGDLIIRMDAHAKYAPDYISKCVEWSLKTGADNVGGPMRAVGSGYLGKAIALIHQSPFGLGGGKFHDENFSGEVDTVYLGAFRREVFKKVGMYDERLVRNQDIELNARIRTAGGKCFLTPEIISYYYNRPNLIAFCIQNYKNGVWNIYTKKIAENALSLRHFIPLFFVSSLLVSILLVLIGRLFFTGLVFSMMIVPFLICFGLYAMSSIAFTIKICREKGFKYLPILPIVFLVLHFSYGLGSLVGILTVKQWAQQNLTKTLV